MRIRLLLLSLLIATNALAQTDKAGRILKEVPLIDGHNDLPWEYHNRVKNHLADLDISKDQSSLEPRLHTDIPRLRKGGLGAQFWSVYVPASLKGADAVQKTLEQIDVVHRLTARHSDTFAPARTADDIVRIHKSWKIASLIGMEGGHSINNSLAALRQFHDAGARYMTLTHSANNDWADSATAAPQHGGLTKFGKAVVAEMNRLGMLVDLSHVAPATMHAALDTVQAPVIFSHSSARAVTNHARNVPDDVLRRLAKNGGVVMVTFVPTFVSEKARAWGVERTGVEARLKELHQGEPDKVKSELEAWEAAHPRVAATLGDVADHVEHIMRVAGEDHVGIGGDFDGITNTPQGLDSVADYPNLIRELLRRGHSEEQLKKLAGLNVLRVMRQAEAVAARMKDQAPADVLIEDR